MSSRLAWSVLLSWGYHEAGHMVAAHLHGLPVLSSTIRDENGLGLTVIDDLDNQEAKAIVAYAGLASQIVFDDLHNVTDEHWIMDREGRTLHDQTEALRAINALLAESEFADLLAESSRLREVARELVRGDGAQPLIVRVAQTLNERITLNEEEIHLHLNGA